MTPQGHDVLSDVLTLIRMRGGSVTTSQVKSDEKLSFEPGHAYFHFVSTGEAELRGSGVTVTTLQPGDLILLPRCFGHTLTVAPEMERTRTTHTRPYQRDGVMELFTGSFQFDAGPLTSLLSGLPEVIRLHNDVAAVPEWLQAILRFLTLEASEPSAGGQLMISRLIDLLVIRTLREWASERPTHQGWLSGLGDNRIGRALAAMHDDPARDWTIEDLASIATMSRSLFAGRFVAAVGEPPLRYLKNWRLTVAADMLRNGRMKVGEVAQQAGYASDAGFSRAFKASFGFPPSDLQRQG